MTTVGPPPKQPKQLGAQRERTGQSSRNSHSAGNEEFWLPLGDTPPDGSGLSAEPSRNGADAGNLSARFKHRWDALLEKIRSGASFQEIVEEFPEVPGWTVSLVAHVLVLVVLSLFHLRADADFVPFEIVTETDEIEEELNVAELTDELNEEVAPDAPVSFTAGKKSSVESVLPDLHKPKEPRPDFLAEATPDAAVAAPESDFINDLGESADLVGEIVNTADDAGSVDRITLEILSRLKKHKLLVVWLMDASASLRSRREQIIERFDRIYHELDELEAIQDDILLTAVVAFGEKTVPMIPEPTADREEIKKAVRGIPTDKSGFENVFGAVKWAASEYHKLQTGGRKTLFIVLTDEIGDDLLRLDDAIDAVNRYEVPVFVMGPASPFGTAKMNMKWTDEASKEVFYLPVDRGPESVVIEHAKLPTWNTDTKLNLLASGFGPYGLSRLVRDSGGIYFLYDDGSIPGPKFDVQNMLHLMPDYVSQTDYQRLMIKSPVRSGVLKIAQATQTKIPDLPTRFLASGIQFEIRNTSKLLGQVVQFLNQAIEELRSAEKFRDKEASKRWQAHYDLLMGRMLATRIRCYRSVPLLQEMFEKPKVPKSHIANGWELAGNESTTFANLAAEPNPDDAKKKPAKKAPAQNADPTAADVPVAKKYLERVVREHPNTPWALMAQSELDFPLDFNWQETFIEPPAGEKLPWDKVPWDKLTPEQKKFVKEYKAKKEKRQQRAKKREEAKKRLPPKL